RLDSRPQEIHKALGQNPFCGSFKGGHSLKNGTIIDVPSEIARRLQWLRTDRTELFWTRKASDEFHSFETSLLTSIAKSNANFTFNNVYEQFCLPKEDICTFYNPVNLHSYYYDDAGHVAKDG
ncbi:hypothetical protein PENTCL1PPCAC_29860, partial [Pristionchus entomophagus]